MAGNRVAVLLGAGASVDAELPMTGGLTRDLIELMDRDVENQTRELAKVFNFVCSAMIGHRGNSGVGPYDDLNVERVFSAIRLLSERSSHEAAPFVTTWLPGVEIFDTHGAPSLDSALIAGINRGLSGMSASNGLSSTVAEIARAAMRPGNGGIYKELDAALKVHVCRRLAKHGDVEYLRPLADLALKQPGGLDVATLNYDLTVESMCGHAKVEVDKGILDWTPGKALTFSQNFIGGINLLKLHGSINWTSNPQVPGRENNSRFIRTQALVETEAEGNRNPAIVIGDREKLAGDGPTLALMNSFEVALLKAQRLVVVGYSFGDTHINALIRNWINANPKRTITVLDPS